MLQKAIWLFLIQQKDKSWDEKISTQTHRAGKDAITVWEM